MKQSIGILIAAVLMTCGYGQSILWMGVGDDPFNSDSIATDVDDSGKYVVGYVRTSGQIAMPVFWEVGVQLTGIQWRPMQSGFARAISRQGDVIVGEYIRSQGGDTSVFVWHNPLSPNFTFRDITDYVNLDGQQRTAWDVVTLENGTISKIVGNEVYGNFSRPVCWEINWQTNSGTGIDLLGNRPREQYTGIARAISSDGGRIVGSFAQSSHSGSGGFIYDGSLTLVHSNTSSNILFFDIADNVRIACGFKSDGNIGISRALYCDGTDIFYLREPYTSYAIGISADGLSIVGGYTTTSGLRACVWDRSRTPVRLIDLTTEYQSILGDSVLQMASAISSDGRFIVGYGYNAQTRRTEGFILDTLPSCTSHDGDVDNSGCVDDADLIDVLFAFGQTGTNLGRVDVDCSGEVDDNDLLVVLLNFGRC